MKEIFNGVFRDGNRLYTINLMPGKKVYGERLVEKQTDAQQKDAKGVMQSASYTLKDLHRPYIDDIRLPCKCGKEMSRIHDVLDVWFDSGLASWASLGR